LDKLRAMKSVVRIVESGSLTAAAADLNVSLSSMVRMLAALEHDLGVTLLNRTTRRIPLCGPVELSPN
jgi:DNA-binding transcriptional LysR family regulator